jgi:hypothetical protein
MHTKDRLVTEIPLAELWGAQGAIVAERGRALGREDVRRLVQAEAVRFVVADLGRPLRWVPVAERYVFWKGEVLPHLVNEPERPFDIYHYPQGYAYIATEWRGADPFDTAIILLERHH